MYIILYNGGKEMKDMITLKATDVRKEWSSVLENTIRNNKPQFIKRTRDYLVLSDIDTFNNLLEPYKFSANRYIEDDGSITLSLNEIDIIENGKTEKAAEKKLAAAILEYATDFYNDFEFWKNAPNRKSHIPYVLKALIVDDVNKIMELITCQDGKR